MSRYSVQTVTIPVSGTTSTQADIRNHATVGVLVPVMTSGNLGIMAAADDDEVTDPTSAQFVDVFATDGSTPFGALVGSGSCALVLSALVNPFSFIKFKSATAQHSARNLLVMMKES